MPLKSAIAPLPSAARSGSGAGLAVDLVQFTTVDLVLVATAIDPSTILDVWVETSDDGASWEETGEHFLELAATGQRKQTFPGLERFVRVAWAITGAGTPHATFAVSGSKVLVLAKPEDLAVLGIPDSRVSDLSETERDRWLRLATDEASGATQERYGMPLVGWGDDLRNVVCSIAAWMILSKVVGVNPEENADKSIQDNSDAAYKKLRDVARGDSNFVGIIDSTPEVENDAGAFIYSDAPRGWSR